MISFPLPSESTNELKLADWLEIYALMSADGNSSRGDLERALRTGSVLESRGRDAVEEKCLAVFFELEQRALAAADSYPYQVDGSTLQLRPDKETYSAYLFCLCLSYFRWSTTRSREIDVNPWLLFEELSALAAAQYIDGEVLSFGTSRGTSRQAMRSFRNAINHLCLKVGEGNGFREQPTLDTKDDKVDLVAWREFQDKKTSKLIMFGQCAGGDDWTDKLRELDPSSFWRQWMQEARVSPHLRSFYVPHRIHNDHWDRYARKADIFFDRCRIAYWAFRNNQAILADHRYKRWYQFVLQAPIGPRRATRASSLSPSTKVKKRS